MTTVLYNADEIEQALARMADELGETPEGSPLAVVGIRRGGEHLATRLAELVRTRTSQEVPVGFVDITLYRDDGFGPNDWPVVGVTDIPFVLREHTVVLVDDVLYTGRTVRAAIDAIIDYGRPQAIKLAVLVDRGLRELPIRADWVGFSLQTTPEEHVDVHLQERGAEADMVTLGAKGNGDEESE